MTNNFSFSAVLGSTHVESYALLLNVPSVTIDMAAGPGFREGLRG